MLPSLFEKLQLTNQKNILVQGLPSTIEKQFAKISFAKNVTPLLKIKKIDFALVFVLNQNQLNTILAEVLPALSSEAKFWIAVPKLSSKIVSDLNRGCTWHTINNLGFAMQEQVALDYVWSAISFSKCNAAAIKENAGTIKQKALQQLVTSKKAKAAVQELV